MLAEHLENLKVPKETEEMAALRSAMEDIRSLAETSQKDQLKSVALASQRLPPPRNSHIPSKGSWEDEFPFQ